MRETLKCLLSCLLGCLLAATCSHIGAWGMTKNFEKQAWDHYAGYYQFSIYNDDLTFHWNK